MTHIDTRTINPSGVPSSLLKYWFTSVAICKNQLENTRHCGCRSILQRAARTVNPVYATIAFLAAIAAIAVTLGWHASWLDFQILRRRTTSSIVVVGSVGQQTAFSLNEKQTNELLEAIASRTETTLQRKSVIYKKWISVYCVSSRNECIRHIWVHPHYGAVSDNIYDVLCEVVARGIPMNSGAVDSGYQDAPSVERVYY
jgi:hypothetical protein